MQFKIPKSEFESPAKVKFVIRKRASSRVDVTKVA